MYAWFAQALPNCPDVDVELSKGRVKILKSINFGGGAYVLLTPAKAILDQVADTLKAIEQVSFRISLSLM